MTLLIGGYFAYYSWRYQDIFSRLLRLSSIIIILTCFVFIQVHHQAVEVGDPALEDAYAWIKEFTPQESVFVINPALEDFRLKAQRAVVVDFKIFPFKETLMVEWYNRIGDVTNHAEFAFRGNRKAELTAGFNTLTTEDAIVLSDKYSAEYILTKKPQSLKLPVAFENSQYTLYQFT